MLLFCSTMHVASGRVRRKTVSFWQEATMFAEKSHLTERATLKIASILFYQTVPPR